MELHRIIATLSGTVAGRCQTWATQDFDCVDHKKTWRILKKWEYQTTLPAS